MIRLRNLLIMFLKYWIKLKRRVLGVKCVRILTRIKWTEAKLEKREMKIEEAVSAYEQCAIFLDEFVISEILF
jgi:hypothetical protein